MNRAQERPASARRSARAGLCRPAAAALLATALAGCSAGDPSVPRPQRRSDVLLVVFDTTRFDDWPSRRDPGGERALTPTLDALAGRGVLFTGARSLYSWTSPSHISLLTGHGIVPGDHPLADLLPYDDPAFGYQRSSLVTILAAHGYRTYAYSGNESVSAEALEPLRGVHVTSEEFPGPDDPAVLQAFGRYGSELEALRAVPAGRRRAVERNRRIVARSAERVNALALAGLRHHLGEWAAEPFFLFVNYNDAHDPYFPQPPFDDLAGSGSESRFNGDLWDPGQRHGGATLTGVELSMTAAGLSAADIRRARDLHRAELAYADHHLGLLLDELQAAGRLADTLVIVTSDHGELFGEHGGMAHSHPESYDELLRVPLLMVLPGGRGAGPARIDLRVDLRDVKPTVLDYLGIRDHSSLGRSLLPVLADPRAELPPPRWEPTDLAQAELLDSLDARSRKRLGRRLKALGYLD